MMHFPRRDLLRNDADAMGLTSLRLGPVAVRAMLAALVVVAVAVRAWGVTFGLPFVQARPDELVIVQTALGFLQGQWWPDFFDYPRLMCYVNAVLFAAYGHFAHAAGWFASFDEFIATWKHFWPPLFLIGRTVAVVSGAATVLVIHRIGRRLGGQPTGLLAAFFLALAFVHVRDSHYATTDVPMTFLAWVAIAIVVGAYDEGSRRRLRLAAAVAALAAATKYSSALLAVPLAAAVILWWREGRLNLKDAARELVLLAAIMIAVFLVLSPYVLFDYPRFSYAMSLLHESYDTGMKTAAPLPAGWIYHLRVSLAHGLGVPLLVAGIAGIAAAAYVQPRRMLLIGAFPVVYYFAAANSRLMFTRYVVPIVPVLCIGAAVLILLAARWVPRRRELVSIAAAVLLVAPSVRSVVLFDRLMQREDSRGLAAEWLRANVAPGARIAQSGSVYGRVGFWRGSEYRPWSMDPFTGDFVEGRRTRVSGSPDVIIVQESPLPYSYVLPQMASLLRDRYHLVQRFRAYDVKSTGNVYDQQDAFFLPYGGFEGVTRPGPNLYVYFPLR